MTAAVLLLAVSCTMTGKVQAKEEAFSSRGSLLYEDAAGRVEWCAEDLLLLRNKLSSIPKQCYDPACYTHEHRFTYQAVNDRTHTRHCDGCGESFDLVNEHAAMRKERCTISHEGRNYIVLQSVCECGWKWARETEHTLMFDPVDAVSHRSRCALENTAYCPGYASVTEEHYAYYYIPASDGEHHEKVCLDCGYQEEETCSFNPENPEDDETGTDENLCRCVCGNSIKQEETEKEPAPAETPEMPEETPEESAKEPEEPSEEPTKEPGKPSEEPTKEPGESSEQEDTSELPSEQPEPENGSTESAAWANNIINKFCVYTKP